MSYLQGAGAVGIGARARDAAAAAAGGELCPLAGGWRGKAHPRPKIVPSTGPGHAWIREEVDRVEDLCYTCKPKYQKNYENVQLKMRKITQKTNLKLRKLCKTTN